MSLYVCVHIKMILGNFVLLIQRTLELFAPEVCKVSKVG